MSRGRKSAFWILAVLTVTALPAACQSVISTHSGVIHFFEGTVYVNDQPLQSHPGRFSSVPQGGELRTADGRAEVLLTPGVILRVGERTTVRMVANALSDTRVELVTGSATVDSDEPTSGTSVTLLYKNWTVRFPEKGSYRVDTNPPQLTVVRGKAEVAASDDPKPKVVGQGMDLAFEPVLVPERSVGKADDALSSWTQGREQSIATDNAIAANIQDPATLTVANSGYDAFTQYPMLGLSSLGPNWSTPYNGLVTYQPGFSSVYLPGYSYLPLMVGVYSVAGWPGSLGGRPIRGGILPLVPRGPALHPMPVSPVSSSPVHGPTFSPRPAPVHPVSVHPAGVGGHVAAHR